MVDAAVLRLDCSACLAFLYRCGYVAALSVPTYYVNVHSSGDLWVKLLPCQPILSIGVFICTVWLIEKVTMISFVICAYSGNDLGYPLKFTASLSTEKC